MKRDMDLIRQLLFYFEAKPDFRMVKSEDIDIPGHERQSIGYHVHLLCEAGFLSCEKIVSTSTPDRLIDALPFRLTWSGHEFLDAARSDTLWQKAKRLLGEKGLSVALGTLQALLTTLARRELALE